MANMLLLGIFVLFSIAQCAPMSCPNEKILSPCNCKRLAFGLQIVCANFNDEKALVKAFHILKDYNVHTVLMHNLYIDEILPSDLFDGLHIKEIRVERSRLRFDQPAFTGLDSSLYVLNVAQQSMIKSNGSFSLAKLTKLFELNVQSNHMQRVNDAWLTDKVPNVNTVILDYNDITVIEDHAFAGLPALKYISLSDNLIKTVKREMFPKPALHLSRIDLSFNEISTLPVNFFEEMPSLKEIILTSNELRTLDQRVWSPVWPQLEQILVTNNRLECNENMNWIKKQRHPNDLQGSCVTPKKKSGRSLKEIYPTT